MQNPGGNPNQQMYYQQQGVPMNNPNYLQMGDQRQQQMMGMQGGMSQAPGVMPQSGMGMSQSSGGMPQPASGIMQSSSGMGQGGMPGSSQMYGSGSMSSSQQQQRAYSSAPAPADAMPGMRPPSQQQMYASSSNMPAYASGETQQHYQQPQHQPVIPPASAPVRHAEPKKEERVFRPLNPPPYSPEVLENLSRYSVYTLSVIGRELVHELLWRTYTLMTVLPKHLEKRVQGIAEPEPLLDYCFLLLAKITEVALRIDLAGPSSGITEDEFLSIMSKPGMPETTAKEAEKNETFESQRQKLVKLSTALKSFEWMTMVSDPRFLKRAD